MPRALTQYQMRPLARRLDIVAKIRPVDLAPDRVRFRSRLFLAQLGITIEIRFRIAEYGFPQPQESRDVPVFDGLFAGIDIDGKVEKVAHEDSRTAGGTSRPAGLQHVQPFDD